MYLSHVVALLAIHLNTVTFKRELLVAFGISICLGTQDIIAANLNIFHISECPQLKLGSRYDITEGDVVVRLQLLAVPAHLLTVLDIYFNIKVTVNPFLLGVQSLITFLLVMKGLSIDNKLAKRHIFLHNLLHITFGITRFTAIFDESTETFTSIAF